MLPIFPMLSLRAPTLDDELPFLNLPNYWNSPAPQEAPTFNLAISAQALLLSAKFPLSADFDSSLLVGSFHEGLWEKDVMELFIADDNTTHYQEFNLSPSGAWWTAAFSAYRKRFSPALQIPSVEATQEIRTDCIIASLQIKRSQLSVDCSFTPSSRANVSAMCGGVAFSWAKIPSEKPDFHLVSSFETLDLRSKP